MEPQGVQWHPGRARGTQGKARGPPGPPGNPFPGSPLGPPGPPWVPLDSLELHQSTLTTSLKRKKETEKIGKSYFFIGKSALFGDPQIWGTEKKQKKNTETTEKSIVWAPAPKKGLIPRSGDRSV